MVDDLPVATFGRPALPAARAQERRLHAAPASVVNPRSSREQLEAACGDGKTRLPSGFEIRACRRHGTR